MMTDSAPEGFADPEPWRSDLHRQHGTRPLQFLDHDVLELCLKRIATVNLKANDTLACYVVVFFYVVHGLEAIERERDAWPVAVYHIGVPIILLHCLGQFLGRRLHQDLVASRFVVQATPIALSDVGLIARDLR